MEQERINKWPYAYDEHNNQASISEAVKMSKRDWYGLPDKQIKFKPYFNNQTPHWKLSKGASFVINGVITDFSNFIDESFEHKEFKGKIIEQKYFIYKGHNVLLNDPKPEVVIDGSRYRADVKAMLLDSTECIIEVIKSSDLSEKKQQFIDENQILTFKIYIDDKGNQIHNRDCITGHRIIEQIAKRIQDGEGKLAELRDNGKRRIAELRNNVERARAKKDRDNKQFESIYDEETSQLYGRTEIYRDRREHIRCAIINIRADITRYERQMSEQSIESEIIRLESEIIRLEEAISRITNTTNTIQGVSKCRDRSRYLETQVRKIIEITPTEWFGYKPNGVTKYQHILYMIS
jgi:hypothetical protein